MGINARRPPAMTPALLRWSGAGTLRYDGGVLVNGRPDKSRPVPGTSTIPRGYTTPRVAASGGNIWFGLVKPRY